MPLRNKIILLVGFMLFSSTTVFYWFTQRLFENIEGVKYSMVVERQHLETRDAEAIENLQNKKEKLSQEVTIHLNRMESDLAKNQQKSDEFDKEFLNGQNEVFDAIDAFNSGKQ